MNTTTAYLNGRWHAQYHHAERGYFGNAQTNIYCVGPTLTSIVIQCERVFMHIEVQFKRTKVSPGVYRLHKGRSKYHWMVFRSEAHAALYGSPAYYLLSTPTNPLRSTAEGTLLSKNVGARYRPFNRTLAL